MCFRRNIMDIASLLEEKYLQYNQVNFIENDPILIPHLFSLKEDIEIMGFFASILAWGQRITIINKCKLLISLFDNAPFDFILNHETKDLTQISKFVHRTFNGTDLLYTIYILKQIYTQHGSLENAFSIGLNTESENIEMGLNNFKKLFSDSEFYPQRTGKHIASPLQKSACKRLCMYLRWMVRNDDKGVDFGLWTKIKPSQLICPCDVHVDRVARHLGLLQTNKTDWNAAVTLTQNLKTYDAQDPVKYDFALFGMGVERYF